MNQNLYQFQPLDFQALESKCGFDQHLSANGYSELCLYSNHLTKQNIERYLELRDQPHYPLGLYRLGESDISHGWGYVQVGNEVPCSLPGFGWDLTNTKNFPEKFRKVQEAAKLDESQKSNKSRLSGKSALISFPGIYTYGHWLIDVPFRFFVLNQLNDESVDNYLIGGPPRKWMLELLQIYSVNLEKVVWLTPLSQYAVEELLVPTILSHSKNGVMPTQIVRSLFGDIKQKNIVNKHSHEIVFVKYQPLTSVNSRHWANQEEVMETLINMGVSILDPLKESVTQTIEKFCRAKLIISQDGSGLHNCIFSNADCVVIETLPRANLLHISIQDVISRKIAYLSCNLEYDGRYYLSHENLDSLVDIVNAAMISR